MRDFSLSRFWLVTRPYRIVARVAALLMLSVLYLIAHQLLNRRSHPSLQVKRARLPA